MTAVTVAALPAEARRTSPGNVWALVGLGFLALQVYVYASWLLSGDLAARPGGPTPVPSWMRAAIRTFEVGSVLAVVAFVWFIVVRPWRRSGRITHDGLFTLAFLTMFWQDPLMNLFNPWFTYNTSYVSVASWAPHIPGWFSPNGDRLPQGVVLFLPAYAYGLFGGAILGGAVMRRARIRWPHLGRLALIGICFVTLVALDTAIECVALRLGLWSFPGAIRGLSLFAGSRHQFPVYEAVLLGGAWTAWASLRFFRDDRGTTAVERGIEDRRTGRRFLALVGVCNTAYLVYNLLFALTALYADPWPEDVIRRSYLTDGFCGPSTTYACPEPALPLARRGSLHVDPDGRLAP